MSQRHRLLLQYGLIKIMKIEFIKETLQTMTSEEFMVLTIDCVGNYDHIKNESNSRIKKTKSKFYRLVHEICAMYLCIVGHKSRRNFISTCL